MNPNVYFISGVTGDLGGALLARLAEDDQNQIYCLVRGKDNQNHQQRLNAVIVENEIKNKQNIFSMEGDICKPNLGLEENDYLSLSKKITHIIHCASDVRFNQPLDQIRLTNVGGTQNILQFAKRCQENNPLFNLFVYVSTAYVAGRRRGIVGEYEQNDHVIFHNSYEQSKSESEAVVNTYMKDGLPVIIFRPSIILGTSGTGKFKKTNFIYPLIMLYNSILPSLILPMHYRFKIDIIPMDYVVNALLYIAENEKNKNQCFHLAAGSGRTIYDTQFIKIIIKELRIKNVRFIPSQLWRYILIPFSKKFLPDYYKKLLKLMKMHDLGGYSSYFRDDNPEFSMENTKKALSGSGIEIPNSAQLLGLCVRYAKETYIKK